ncbi:heparinase II/III family protein [uncultured Marixanthomonas sp.]|uniref:heparinase II/III domain-containing protein n=1 Tax=uncultured Marixanthomonas sp. TaxID=757245 RepID=UPI0030DBAAC4|tara:strand:+ start:11595 stop:13493 length:1899 start_codon:yes stop_codon:yes gene_type:complete
MKNLLRILDFFQNMGFRYVLFRIEYLFNAKTGILKTKFPTSPTFKTFITLKEWRTNTPPFFFQGKNIKELEKTSYPILKDTVKKIKLGKIKFFSSQTFDLGINYDWITNPETGYQYNIEKHWSEIQSFSEETGDIKFVWEKARFSYLYDLIRFDYHFQEDQSKFVFSEIEDFIAKNPINQGPNYVCSQEMSLRIINWTFALYYYKESPQLTEARFAIIMNSIYWQLHHVRQNIHFSRIAVRNNHAITETLMLSLAELLFPFFPESKKWAKDGRKWFEQEIDYQIYKDGTFLQFSMNYHRVVIQLLSLGLSLTEIHKKPFSKNVYNKAYKSVNFLYQCMMDSSGHLPNQGSNDGALFFPLTNTEYRDYRSQLNTLHSILTEKDLFKSKEIVEEKKWFGSVVSKFNLLAILEKKQISSFEKGGYYMFRDQESFSFFRCGVYKSRPNQSDNLHFDLWYKGENILWDTGSFKYNTTKKNIAFFRGVEGHNTVSVNGEDQMLKGSRFIWYYWVKNAAATLQKDASKFKFQGTIRAFRQIKRNIYHTRSVQKIDNQTIWSIEDKIKNTNNLELTQYWQINPDFEHFVTITSKDFEGNTLQPIREVKSYSSYYGKKQNSIRLSFKTKGNGFTTLIKLNK